MESEWLIVLSAEARLAWVQLLCYTKTHGLAGRVKVKPTAVFARQSYLGEESVEQMIRAAKADGALEESDGDWVITGWGKHQGDETAAERMRRLRAKKERKDAESADAQVQTGPNVTGVTRNKANVTVEEKRREEKRGDINPPPPRGEQVKRHWRNVRDELVALLPQHSEAISKWCKYRHELKSGKPYTPSTAETWGRKYAEWPVARFASMIDHTIEKGWQGPQEPPLGAKAGPFQKQVNDDWQPEGEVLS
jgi:hypothetical protein